MKSSAQRMNALLKVREAELEAAVSRLLESVRDFLRDWQNSKRWNLKRRRRLPKSLKMQKVMTPYYTAGSWQDCAEKHCD